MYTDKVNLIAHRGYSYMETENTCAAFIAAGNRSHFGIETDIHVTKDGKFIVIHDDHTGRVAGDDMLVEKTCFETLRAVHLLNKDGEKSRGDLIMPTLKEYISICRHYNKKSVLELKNHFDPADIARVIAEIRDMAWLDNTIFISFDLPNMICIREMLPDQPAQFLISTYPDWLEDTLCKYHLDLDIKFSALTAEHVKKLHESGVKVNVWTVDKPEDADRMLEYGVDYITSNCLE